MGSTEIPVWAVQRSPYGPYRNPRAVDNSKGGDHNLCMTLSELLMPDLVVPGIACASKDELIRKLVQRVYGTDLELPLLQQDMQKTIYIRELIGGTLLPSGLSIPHARLRDFEGFIIALGTPADPLFHEGIQIRMMALMITSHSGVPWYLSVLAALTKISKDSEYFSRLCRVQDTENFFHVLRERDTELA